jgi:hypothetical protein
VPLTDLQKAGVRRHLEFPVAGLPLVSPAGGTLASGNAGYRFLEAYGQLEFRMNNLHAMEEAMVTGATTGAVALVGPAVTPGVAFSLTVSGGPLGSPVVLNYTSISGDSQASVVANFASLVNQNATLTAAGFYALNPYGFGPFSQNTPGGGQTGNAAIPLAQLNLLCIATGVIAFTLATTSSGAPSFIVTAQGVQPPPTVTVSMLTNPSTTRNGFIPILDWLEGEQGGTTQNLGIIQAGKGGEVIFRLDEIRQREELYGLWQRKLWTFLLGDGRGRSQGIGGRGGGMRSVV